MSLAPRRLLITACAAATLVVLAGCSSSTNGSPATNSDAISAPSNGSGTGAPSGFPSDTGAPSGTPATTKTVPTQNTLKALVLQASDLPTGWTGATYEPDPDEAKNQAAFAKCTGARDTNANKIAEVHSDDYSSGDATISSQASSYKSAADVDSDRAAISSPKASSCYQQLAESQMNSSLPPGVSIDHLEVKITKPAPGDPSNVIGHGAATVVVSQSGQQLTVYTQATFIAGTFVEAEVDFTNVGAPVASDVQAQLVKIVADRVANS